VVSCPPSDDPLISEGTEGALRTWTFAICFGGNLVHLKSLVESIRRRAANDDEILIVADVEAEVPASLGAKVIRVGGHSHALAVKKHRLVAEARGDFLCILHDYLELSDGWREGFESLGATWDVALAPTLDPTRRNRRIADWMTLDHPVWGHGLSHRTSEAKPTTCFCPVCTCACEFNSCVSITLTLIPPLTAAFQRVKCNPVSFASVRGGN